MKRIIKAIFVPIFVISFLLFCIIGYVKSNIADEYKVISGENLKIQTSVPVTVKYCGENLAEVTLNKSVGTKLTAQLKIFGIIPVAKAKIEVVNQDYVVVLGRPFGMKIYTDGVLVVNTSDVDTQNGNYCPATKCGIKIGDSIISINGQKVYTNEDVSGIIEKCGGKPLNFIIKRNGKTMHLKISPQISQSTGVYKAGIWVRDSSAGIGTLTFYSPVNNIICGLGHGICDSDTGQLLPINSGEMAGAEIVSLTKAVAGTPGELTGRITALKHANIALNSENGVYGVLTNPLDTENLTEVAAKQEIENGNAYILTTINGTTPKMYTCSIKLNLNSKKDKHDIIVKITDGQLLCATGGVLQGMSGSPLIQNGKLIGAITHVLVDVPTTGYAIFAENMLETAQSVANENELKEVS